MCFCVITPVAVARPTAQASGGRLGKGKIKIEKVALAMKMTLLQCDNAAAYLPSGHGMVYGE